MRNRINPLHFPFATVKLTACLIGGAVGAVVGLGLARLLVLVASIDD